ncbi:MAG: VCBS repeat-containing protein [Candidatus Cloacimonetes bacterium]|nr:VCBS repeat-containing protein [Candidatus Cloacimonadota bacterium]
MRKYDFIPFSFLSRRSNIILAFLCVGGFLFSSGNCQTFLEIYEQGWGSGMMNSKPVFYDIDNDGYLDLFVGEKAGNINHFEQDTLGTYSFNLVTPNFNNINPGPYSAPFFCDIDNDGLIDLFVGEINGNINHFEQTALFSYEFSLITENFNNIDVGMNSVPFFIDIDDDNLLDLIIGKGPFANLTHYEQTEEGSYDFEFITNNFLPNMNYGNTYPTFTDIDNDGLFDLIIGTSGGDLRSYEQVSQGSYEFEWSDIDFYGVGYQAAPVFHDIDDDGLLDLLIGEEYGNLTLYEYDEYNYYLFPRVTQFFGWIDIGLASKPDICDLDNNGLLDLLVGSYYGLVIHYEQNSENSLKFNYIDYLLICGTLGDYSSPTILDFDNDGLLDLFVGYEDGNISHFEQENLLSEDFELVAENFADIDVGLFAVPIFEDIDNDGFLDLLIGESLGKIFHYEQDLTNEFILISDNFCNIDAGFRSAPAFTDLDDNDKLDLLIGETNGSLHHYEQSEINSYNFELISNNFNEIDVIEASKPSFADINNDGLDDLLVGAFDGGVYLYLHTFGITNNNNYLVSNPEILCQNYPNPFNPTTTISFSIPEERKVELAVYNIKGQKVKTLVNEALPAGEHSVIWDGKDSNENRVCSGIYFYRFTAGNYHTTKKCAILK